MIPHLSIPSTEQVYTFANTTGSVTIAITRLLRYLDSPDRAWSPVAVDVPIKPRMLQEFAKTNSISVEKLKKLATAITLGLRPPPILFGHDGTTSSDGRPNVFLIDGRHRYTLYTLAGLHFIPSYIVERPLWEPFQVDLPTITPEQLRRIAPSSERTPQ